MERGQTSQKQAYPHIRFAEAQALATELRGIIRGDVRFDAGIRALYATDGSNYRQIPVGVVLPKDEADVVATVAACQLHGVPLLPRGGGTSLAGQCCNVPVVLDLSRYMNTILAIDPHNRLARVQLGVILAQLRDAAEQHHLTFDYREWVQLPGANCPVDQPPAASPGSGYSARFTEEEIIVCSLSI